ncbi:MAG: GNAT family N-acetyltransferase [Clostridia bacterium]|nr:GNAT family N-acetyltransferase [Clostridia bacterium]
MKEKRRIIATPRLTLRPLEDGDRAALLRICGDERVKSTYMLPDFADAAQAEAFFRRLQALSASAEHFLYGICLNGGGLIGLLNDCEMDGNRIELGYFIAPEHWNRGYATEALGAAIRELFRMGYGCVTAGYFAENAASRRVMEKCGMRPLAEESMISYRGRDRRCLYCGIAAADERPIYKRP